MSSVYGDTGGSFVKGEATLNQLSTFGDGITGHIIDFNAALSNSIYGSSYTVQPAALNVLLLIKF